MTDAFYIQIKRGDGWRKVTTVHIDARSDRDRPRARSATLVEATRQLTSWQSYDGFAGMPLRIAEEIGFGKFVEARP